MEKIIFDHGLGLLSFVGGASPTVAGSLILLGLVFCIAVAGRGELLTEQCALRRIELKIHAHRSSITNVDRDAARSRW